MPSFIGPDSYASSGEWLGGWAVWLADVHAERIAQEAARARQEFELLKYGMAQVSVCGQGWLISGQLTRPSMSTSI
jgi:hypothetical protein